MVPALARLWRTRQESARSVQANAAPTASTRPCDRQACWRAARRSGRWQRECLRRLPPSCTANAVHVSMLLTHNHDTQEDSECQHHCFCMPRPHKQDAIATETSASRLLTCQHRPRVLDTQTEPMPQTQARVRAQSRQQTCGVSSATSHSEARRRCHAISTRGAKIWHRHRSVRPKRKSGSNTHAPAASGWSRASNHCERSQAHIRD